MDISIGMQWFHYFMNKLTHSHRCHNNTLLNPKSDDVAVMGMEQ
jgi:hypothetical protein